MRKQLKAKIEPFQKQIVYVQQAVLGVFLCFAVVILLIANDGTKKVRTDSANPLVKLVTVGSLESDKTTYPTRPTTINAQLQHLILKTLSEDVQKTKAKRGTVIIMDINTGAIKAMTSIDSANDNIAVKAWEPGSIMKPLMMAAALNEGAVTPDTVYFDPGHISINGRVILNAINLPPQTVTMQDIITKSLNTGAVYLLKSLGDGSLNKQARSKWYTYLTEYYRFGKSTGIDLPEESSGYVRPPTGGQDLDFRYAGSAFGVGLTVTPIQMVSAYSSLFNGGRYHQPYLAVFGEQDGLGAVTRPHTLTNKVISSQVGHVIQNMMQAQLAQNNKTAYRSGYIIGGKSGTAPVPEEGGSYGIGVDSGSYIGFIGVEKIQYIMLVRLDEPHTKGFASSEAAKTWARMSNAIIDHGLLR